MKDDSGIGIGFTFGLIIGILLSWFIWKGWAFRTIDTVEQIEKFKQEKIADAHRLYSETLAREEQP